MQEDLVLVLLIPSRRVSFCSHDWLAGANPSRRVLNVDATDVDALNSAKSIAHVFDPKNLANVTSDKPRLAFYHDGSNRAIAESNTCAWSFSPAGLIPRPQISPSVFRRSFVLMRKTDHKQSIDALEALPVVSECGNYITWEFPDVWTELSELKSRLENRGI
jgi:hypothetical protein